MTIMSQPGFLDLSLTQLFEAMQATTARLQGEDAALKPALQKVLEEGKPDVLCVNEHRGSSGSVGQSLIKVRAVFTSVTGIADRLKEEETKITLLALADRAQVKADAYEARGKMPLFHTYNPEPAALPAYRSMGERTGNAAAETSTGVHYRPGSKINGGFW
jgi:hypothetical protein